MKLLTKSAGQKDILMYQFGDPQLPTMVLIGGVHGDEPEGALVVEDFIEHAKVDSQKFKCNVIVIPSLNPDGLAKNERTNDNGVDLNRNFPASDWSKDHKAPRYYPGPTPASEPEVKALVQILKESKPFLVVHCHTYIPQICYTGEKSKKWAEILIKDFGYPMTDDIGYPTPGSLGQYCFHDLKSACVCIELPENVERSQGWKIIGPALLEIALRGP